MPSDHPKAQDSAPISFPFDLVKELSSAGAGAGAGAASTWLARTRAPSSDPTDVRLTEVVRINSQVTEKAELKATVLRDAEHAQKLEHPNAIRVQSAASFEQEILIATEIIEGASLQTLLVSAGPEGIGTDVILRVGLDVLEALAAAHALSPEPLVHGELSPLQIIVGPDGMARVAGFGTARALAKADPTGPRTQVRLGYAAPERIKTMTGAATGKDAANPDPRSDLFSVGVILWEGIAKQRLFAAKMDAAVLQKVLTAPIASLASLPKVQVSAGADAAISKALERDPARRWQSAAELIAALQKDGPATIATRDKVAATVERLSGRIISSRRAELAAALNAPAVNPSAPPSKSAPASSGAPEPPQAPRRKVQSTLLGMPQISPAQILAAVKEAKEAKEPESAADNPKAAAAHSPANETAKMSKQPSIHEIVDEKTIDDEWLESADDAAKAAPPPPAPKPAAPAPAAAAKPAAPAAAKPAAPAAAKPAAPAPVAPKPAATAAPTKAAAAPAAPTAAAADKGGAKPRFQVALPSASPRGGSKTPVPSDDEASADAKAADNAAAAPKADEAKQAPAPAAASPAVAAPAAPAAPPKPTLGQKPPAAPKPAAPSKSADEAPKAPAITKPAAPPAPPKPGVSKPVTIPPAVARKDETGKPTAPPAAPPSPTAAKPPAPKPAAPKPAAPQAPPAAAAKPPAPKPALPAPPPPAAPADAARASSDDLEVSPALTPGAQRRAAEAIDKVRPGSTLGRYEILMPVAKGGMAAVWAARLQGTRGFQKIVAIKTMLPDVSDDPEFESMFLDEARVAARIRHPNVVEIYDLGEQDDVLYIVMEWIDGETLTTIQKAAKAVGGVPLPILLRLASQICAGLHSAHELRDDGGAMIDLIHRDISPGNVLVSSSGFVKVADFGIAKSKGRLHVTRGAGVLKGKTPYLSPEQLRGIAIDRRSDIFSLGTLLYVMTTGLHPFRADTEAKTMENIALHKPMSLREIAPTVNAEWEKIILKALEKDRANRFATAGEMQRAIDQLASSIGSPTTDEDVASFVQKAIGETLKERARNLRAAISAADGPSGAGAVAPQASAAAADAKPEAASGAPEGKESASASTGAAASSEAPAGDAAPPPGFDDITIDEEPLAEASKEDAAAAREASPKDGALIAATPGAPPPGDVNAPKVVVASTEAPATTDAVGDVGAALGSPGELATPAVQMPLESSSSTPGTSSDGLVGERATSKDEENPFAPKKRSKAIPIAAGALLFGIIVGGLALSSGGGKTGGTAAPERTGSEAAASATMAAAPTTAAAAPTDAPKPAESAAEAVDTAAAAASAAPSAAPAAETAEPAAPTAEPVVTTEPAPTKPPPVAAATGGIRPTPTTKTTPTTTRPTPTRTTPVKPGPIKTKPPKYNPSGI